MPRSSSSACGGASFRSTIRELSWNRCLVDGEPNGEDPPSGRGGRGSGRGACAGLVGCFGDSRAAPHRPREADSRRESDEMVEGTRSLIVARDFAAPANSASPSSFSVQTPFIPGIHHLSITPTSVGAVLSFGAACLAAIESFPLTMALPFILHPTNNTPRI